ncbi:MAG: protein kinase [Gemmatimonadaceae bacterium]|nr:protein kinase [Gemmatimonadaceae bacterium]
MIGTVVGNYRIVEKLGDGGMGAVYRAVDELLDREVALKVLRSELAGQASLIERFRAEAIALARLNHPRIATLHGLERNGVDYVMIMEYVRGETLEQVVARSGGLSWVRAVEICVEICDALDHAHDKGVVHRDIKPANVMLSSTGLIKVMDFGIARVVGRDRQTQFGHAVGTPMYMAPEQLRGEDVDGRADLYALGAVLFELITGRMAFEADSDYALMMKQLHEPPTPPSAIVKDVPDAVDAIVLKAMAKAREDRFFNAATMRASLRDALQAGPRKVAHAAVPPTRIDVESRESAAVATPAAAPVVASVAAGMPPTRVASSTPAASDGMPETRYAAAAVHDVPATRLGLEASFTTAESPTVPTGGWLAREGRKWQYDRRRWLTGALLFVATGASALKYMSAGPDDGNDSKTPVGGTPVRGSLGDTTQRTTPQGGGVVEPPARGGVQIPKVGGLQDVGGGKPVPTPPTIPPSGGRGRRPADTPKVSRPQEPQPVVPHGEAPPEIIAVPPVVSKPAEAVSPEAGFRAEVARKVEFFVQAIRDRDVATVERLLLASGTNRSVHDQLIALLRAGRVEVSDVNVTNRSRAEGGGSAQFDATLNFRSPFGANRKTVAQFAIDLSRDAGDWNLVSAQVIGSPKFR